MTACTPMSAGQFAMLSSQKQTYAAVIVELMCGY